MLKVGITGGIGSGKTTVCRMFELLGIPVFYADDEAKKVMHTDKLLREELLQNFGPAVYSNRGELDRKYLAEIVFRDEEELRKLNALVHPAVFRAFDQWVEKYQDAPYIIKEAALLFESDSYKMCDTTIVVKAPENVRIARVMKRDRVNAEQVRQRMNKQLSEEKKEELAEHILINDESVLLIPQILVLHQKLLGAK